MWTSTSSHCRNWFIPSHSCFTTSQFLTHAFATAVYSINRLPTPTLNKSSPFTNLFKTEPNYSKLRSFGCLWCPWLRPYTHHKLGPKSTPCIFLGYSPNQSAYYCYDPITHKTYVSRHVKFVEKSFPFAQLNPSIPSIDLEEWYSLSIPMSPLPTASISQPNTTTSTSLTPSNTIAI